MPSLMTRHRIPRYWILEERPSLVRRRRRQRWALALFAAVALSVILLQQMAFADEQLNTADAAEAMLIALNESGGGALLFKSAHAGRYRPAAVHNSEAEFAITGLMARVSLRQRFTNSSGQWREAVYVFPLPDDAAVNAMRIRVGERVIEGVIKEREQARKVYAQARARGQKAGLLEQQRPNLFTTGVANIGPGETVDVELAYWQPVVYDGGTFSLRFPMTITPRYMPGAKLADDPEKPLAVGGPLGWQQQAWAENTDQVADASLISPPQMPEQVEGDGGNRITLRGELNMGMPLRSITSAYHPIVLNRSGDHYAFELAAREVPMQQDFVLSWRAQLGQQPKAAVFTENLDGDTYATLMILPPEQHASNNKQTLAKEQVFIIDTSGSMGGTSIKQAKASLHLALQRLKPQDRFNIVEFNSNTRLFSPLSVPADVHNIARARQMVNSMHADGGTEMLPALHLAMQRGHASEHATHLRQIVFITDGAVGNEQALFQTIQQQLGGSRLFTVGIGSAPNSHFMRKASQFGRGSFTHIGDINEVQEKMTALLDKLERPVVTEIQVTWPSGIRTENYPQNLPDLYHGEPLTISSRIDGGLPAGSELPLVVRGQTASQSWQRELQVQVSNASHRGVATLWARRKISELLDSRVLGAKEAVIREKVLAVALPHALMSPYTSFVAVEKQVSRPQASKLSSSAIANERPKGQTAQTFAYPQGSSEARQSLAWGALLLLMGLIIRFSLRAEARYVLRA